MKMSDVLSESIPSSWDATKLSAPYTLSQALEYIKARAGELGNGASRAAFEATENGKTVVVKLATKTGGIESNRNEIKMLSSSTIQSYGFVLPLLGADQSSQPMWMVVPKASPASETDFQKATGSTVEDLMNFVLDATHPSDDIFAEPEPIQTKTNPNLEWVQSFKQFCKKMQHITSLMEFADIRNWGVYKGRLVVIDLGHSYISHEGLLDTAIKELNA